MASEGPGCDLMLSIAFKQWKQKFSVYLNSFLTKLNIAKVNPRETLAQMMHQSHTKRLSATWKCLTLSCSAFCPKMIPKKLTQFYFYEYTCSFCLIWPVTPSSLTSVIRRRKKLPAQFALVWREWLMQSAESGIQQNMPYQCRQVLI